MQALTESYPFLVPWVFLPLLIFCARTGDVSLSTLRIVSIAQGRTLFAAGVGFFESLIWLGVIGQILDYLHNPLCVVAYAAGFATGNIVGLKIERRLAIGQQIVRVIVPGGGDDLIEALRDAGHGVTVIEGHGAGGPVRVLFTVVRRSLVPAVTDLVEERFPRAFYSIEDVRRAAEGVFVPGRQPLASLGTAWPPLRWLRKAK